MLTVLSVLGVLVVLFIAAAVATREGPILADAPVDAADLDLPSGQLQPEDLQAVRFALAIRGYRMDEVDRVLDRAAAELAERDRTILALQDSTAPRADATAGGEGASARVAPAPGPTAAVADSTAATVPVRAAADLVVAAFDEPPGAVAEPEPVSPPRRSTSPEPVPPSGAMTSAAMTPAPPAVEIPAESAAEPPGGPTAEPPAGPPEAIAVVPTEVAPLPSDATEQPAAVDAGRQDDDAEPAGGEETSARH